MRYEKKSDLPKTLQETMPEPVQEFYLQAYKDAYDNYTDEEGGDEGRDAVSHRDAMHAVEREFVHDPQTGQWYRKGAKPPEEEKREGGFLERLRDRIKELA